MKTIVVALALVALIFVAFGGWAVGRWSAFRTASIAETSADAELLGWLDHADVIADFKEHVERQRDTRFVSMFAFSTAGAVGLDDTPEIKSLVQKHGERHLEGTGDVISSAEQQRLLHKASDYVKQYNILLLHYLRGHPNT